MVKNPKVTSIDAKATKETKIEAPVTGVKVTVLCKQHGLNPKQVRARLRRMYRNEELRPTLPNPLSPGTWTFAEKDRKAVEKLIASMATVEKE